MSRPWEEVSVCVLGGKGGVGGYYTQMCAEAASGLGTVEGRG